MLHAHLVSGDYFFDVFGQLPAELAIHIAAKLQAADIARLQRVGNPSHSFFWQIDLSNTDDIIDLTCVWQDEPNRLTVWV